MRTLFLALMIALLPVRGWLGDAMAIEMARHSMPAASAPAASAAAVATEAHCHEAEAGMAMDDAPAADNTPRTMHAMQHDAHPAADAHGAHGDGDRASHQGCGTCTACQVCHSVALGGGDEAAGIAHGAPQAVPAAPAARFASAEPAQGLKPPIS